jgi:AcrR family transcriptional regulator
MIYVMTSPAESHRERKKAATRQRIADEATRLFLARGFDRVTTTEIAEAADVSKMTVFNYFARKEDIFFDRLPQAAELLTSAIRDRAEDESPLTALRRLLVGLAEQQHPLGGFREHYGHFWQTILDSPALRSRMREALDELEDVVTDALATYSDDRDPRLTAALALAGYRTSYRVAVSRILAGDPAADVTRAHIAAVHHAFDVVQNGLDQRR